MTLQAPGILPKLILLLSHSKGFCLEAKFIGCVRSQIGGCLGEGAGVYSRRGIPWWGGAGNVLYLNVYMASKAYAHVKQGWTVLWDFIVKL